MFKNLIQFFIFDPDFCSQVSIPLKDLIWWAIERSICINDDHREAVKHNRLDAIHKNLYKYVY